MNPGFYDISTEEYFSESFASELPPMLSQSTAHTLIARCPALAHRYHPRLGGRKRAATKAMDTGTIVHRMLLGKGGEYAVAEWSPPAESTDKPKKGGRKTEAPPGGEWQNWARSDAKAARAAIVAQGRIPMLPKEKRITDAIVRQFRDELDHYGIDLSGHPEAVVYWQEGGVHCRGMLDMWAPNQMTIYDVKVRRSAHPRAIQGSMFEDGCDIQAAAYLSAVDKIHPEYAGRFRFVFLFCEVGTGLVTPVVPSESFLELGRKRWKRALDLWSHCLTQDSWPGYVQGVYSLEPADWMLASEEIAQASHYEGLMTSTAPRSRQDNPSRDEEPEPETEMGDEYEDAY